MYKGGEKDPMASIGRDQYGTGCTMDGCWGLQCHHHSRRKNGGSPANVRNMEEFNAVLFNCGLVTVDFDGQPYTWTNGTVWQRLDRVVVNNRFTHAYDTVQVSYLTRGRYDRATLLIRCNSSTARSSSFRFINAWSHYQGFLEAVKDAWEEPVTGVGMQIFFSEINEHKEGALGMESKIFWKYFYKSQKG